MPHKIEHDILGYILGEGAIDKDSEILHILCYKDLLILRTFIRRSYLFKLAFRWLFYAGVSSTGDTQYKVCV